ncbi:hypothetical protein BDV30DRAFT_230024 [Aspergillus minisclerotigenes]|uniref:Uncharacterized protein n=1 Tax=Aspergillus minisclerotigenes TaxID=656917 RepID=A0A5N6IS77_9EURO|nr:hypothetical protein BDV30DRAFT_230024 [Aspergillus minisclerotigenes]
MDPDCNRSLDAVVKLVTYDGVEALQSLCGEIYYISLSKSVIRLLVTGKAGDQAHTINPGDFASIPPGSKFIRLIVPDDKNNLLPGALCPYFLRAGYIPAYYLEELVVWVLATTKELDGKFSISSLERSLFYYNKILAISLVFLSIHHVFYITKNIFKFHINGVQLYLTVGKILYMPRVSILHLRYLSWYTKYYIFASSRGLVEFFIKGGNVYSSPIIPELEDSVNMEQVRHVG